MAIAYRDTSVATGTTSASLSKPTNTVVGDIMIVFKSDRATSGTTSPPSGWTRALSAAGTSGRGEVFWAIYGAPLVGAGPWSFTGTTNVLARCVSYSGVNNTTPMDVAGSIRRNASGVTGTTSITPVTNNNWIIAGFSSIASTNTWTNEAVATSPTLTERIESAGTLLDTAVADGTQATAGATGVSSGTVTATINVCSLIALRPYVYDVSKEFPAKNYKDDNPPNQSWTSTIKKSAIALACATSFAWSGYTPLTPVVAMASPQQDVTLVYKKQIQYKAVTQPVYVPVVVEDIYADKWQPIYPNYHYQKPSVISAIQSGSYVGPARNDFLEEVHLNWIPIYETVFRPLKNLPAAIQAGSLSYTSQEKVLADRWGPIYPDFLYQKPIFSRAIYPNLSSFIVLFSNNKNWSAQVGNFFPAYPWQLLPQKGIPSSIQAGSLFLGDIPRNETILLDKWLGKYPDLLLSVKRAIIDSTVNPLTPIQSVEIITADKWQPVYPNYFQKKNLLDAIRSGSLFFGDIPRQETITIDKWIGNYPDIIFSKLSIPGSIQSGVSFFVAIPPPYVPPTAPRIIIVDGEIAIYLGGIIYTKI
jgi:hypothetical protein